VKKVLAVIIGGIPLYALIAVNFWVKPWVHAYARINDPDSWIDNTSRQLWANEHNLLNPSNPVRIPSSSVHVTHQPIALANSAKDWLAAIDYVVGFILISAAIVALYSLVNWLWKS
jgi:hypothetical protein